MGPGWAVLHPAVTLIRQRPILPAAMVISLTAY